MNQLDLFDSKPADRGVKHVHPVTEVTASFLVQTARERERGDTIFVQCVSAAGMFRVALPPEVADMIARQRDALTTANRKRAGRERAARDKAAGVLPGFMRNGSAKKKAKGGKRKAAPASEG